MPGNFGGSLCAVAIDKTIYFCGGIKGGTISSCGSYNVITGASGSMANLPTGVNHAAAATDGTKIYIFGGR
jgi:hypothetical protein